MKNFFDKKDVGLASMREHGMLPQIISEHMRNIYSIAKEKYLKYLREKYPELVARYRAAGDTVNLPEPI